VGRSGSFDFEGAGGSEDLSLVARVDEVYNIASIDFESNLGREEVRTIIKIYISRDGEWAIEEGFVRVGDRNIDRVGIPTANRPRNIISRELNPIQAIARPTNRYSERGSNKRNKSQSFGEHCILSYVLCGTECN